MFGVHKASGQGKHCAFFHNPPRPIVKNITPCAQCSAPRHNIVKEITIGGQKYNRIPLAWYPVFIIYRLVVYPLRRL